jgi:hypothetical protein
VSAENGAPNPLGAAAGTGAGNDAARKKRMVLFLGIGAGAVLLVSCCCCGIGGWWTYDKYLAAPPFVGNWTSGPNAFLQLESNHRGKYFTDPFNPPAATNLSWKLTDNILEITLDDAKSRLWSEAHSGRFMYEVKHDELTLTNTTDKARATFQKFEPRKK